MMKGAVDDAVISKIKDVIEADRRLTLRVITEMIEFS